MFCEPEVPFSINHNLLTVLGAIVIVQAESNVPVYFRNKDLPGSVAPSAIVVVCVSALVVIASVPKENASAISSRLVLVVSPQEPDCSPEPISSNRKSFTYVLAIFLSYAAMSAQDGVCEGVTPEKFGVWDGIINPHGCCNSPISPVADTPVTVTLALPVVSAVAALTEAVIVTIVLVVKKLPNADVAETPVTETFAMPVTVTAPTALVPATPVTEMFASPETVDDPTEPVAVTV